MNSLEERCPLCRARMLKPTDRSLRAEGGKTRGFALTCASCGLLIEERDALARVRAELTHHLETSLAVDRNDLTFGLDAYTARIAATMVGRRFMPADERQKAALRHPHGDEAAEGTLLPMTVQNAPAVALGLICRAGDVEAVLASLPAHAGWASEALIMADGPPAPPVAISVAGFAFGTLRVAYRPLGGNFAEQRNALQEMSQRPWVMQLDADETLDARTAELLPALARMADEDGLASIGLPRRNLVDGALSDVYPDVQYRLNRREIRYDGAVHERPERPWQRSTISLHGAIDHHLSGAHVLERSARYEAMAPGRGRREEVDALLRPYRD